MFTLCEQNMRVHFMTDETATRQQVLVTLRENTGLDIQCDADNIVIKQSVGQARITSTFHAKFVGHVTEGINFGLLITNPPTILIAPEIPEPVRTALRRQKIGYLDGLGNAYLDAPPIFLMVAMQPTVNAEKPRTEKTPAKIHGAVRAFNETGLRLLFALLNEPGLEKLPYRDLAQKTGLALGTVHNAIAALKELKYLRTRGKTKVLLDKRDLLEKCVNNFPDQLRPRLLRKKCRPPLQAAPDWWKTADLTGLDACWGGEPGAELLTRYLQAERLTLYVFGDPNDPALPNAAMQRLHLIPDEKGTVEIMWAFWPKPEKEPDMPCAPPLVVYADLLATRDGRNREVAQKIYDDHLLQIIE